MELVDHNENSIIMCLFYNVILPYQSLGKRKVTEENRDK